MSVAATDPAVAGAGEVGAARQAAFVRAELIRRLFEGSAQSRYFSFVLWPVIAALYWRQADLLDLAIPFAAHVAVTIGFDVLRRNFAQARPADQQVIRWGWWFAVLCPLTGGIGISCTLRNVGGSEVVRPLVASGQRSLSSSSR